MNHLYTPAWRQLRHLASAASSQAGLPARLQLVRDFIQESLYHPSEGYFTRQQQPLAVVGSPPAPINFPSLSGRTAYLQAVSSLYKQLAVQWLTPVELFQPYYGAAVARYIWRQHVERGRAHQPLRIYELGGGTGTLARGVLDWLRQHQPEAYAYAHYTCVEISPHLAQLQWQKVAGLPACAAAAPLGVAAASLEVIDPSSPGRGTSASDPSRPFSTGSPISSSGGGSSTSSSSSSTGSSSSNTSSSLGPGLSGGHAGRYSVRCHDAADAAAWTQHDATEGQNHQHQQQQQQGSDSLPLAGCPPRQRGQAGEEQHCYILAFEVLDNLPHDRVQREGPGSPWLQTMVRLPASDAAGGDSTSGSSSSSSDGRSSDRGSSSSTWGGQADGAGFGAGAGSGGWAASQPRPEEVLLPVSDPLIQRCLACLEGPAAGAGRSAGSRPDSFDSPGSSPAAAAAAPGWGSRLKAALQSLMAGAAGEVTWLPTGCLRLLDTLHQVRPSHTLIAADFDALPEVQLEGRNAPLVATTTGGTTVDHSTYLVPRGAADIFFPTDFSLLQQLYLASARHVHGRGRGNSWRDGSSMERRVGMGWQHTGAHLSTRQFMAEHADLAGTATRSGYNPLLEDYTNTAFFLATASKAAAGMH